MKLIHTADIHLGSKMDSKFPKEVSAKRKSELRSTFQRMVGYAQKNGVRAILLAGDVFDSDTPTLKDKEFFYSIVRSTPAVDFLYLKGNHDIAAYAEEVLPNLKTFSAQWQYYDYGDAVIAGVESSEENAASLYSTLSLSPDRLNIVVLHGQIGDSAGKDKICLKRLHDKNIDYLALGHVHKMQSGKLDDRGDYAYCGCLEGRGFDEPGEHGFFLLETGKKLTRTFIPFAARTIRETDVAIDGAADAYAAYMRIREQIQLRESDIYRVDLIGELDPDVEIAAEDVASYLKACCFFADVKNKTTKKFDRKQFEGDLSLKGEFVRTVFGSDLPEEEKRRIAAIGLKALRGGDLDL